MKRLTLAAAALVVFALPVLAAAQPSHVDSPKVTIMVPQQLIVGTAILQPGEYKFQCRTFNGETFLVVTSVDTGKELTRVRCEREQLESKVADSQFSTLVRPDGKRKLTVLNIKGEVVAHHIAD